MIWDQQKLYTIMIHIVDVNEYKIWHFWANPQKYQTLVPTKKIITLKYGGYASEACRSE